MSYFGSATRGVFVLRPNNNTKPTRISRTASALSPPSTPRLELGTGLRGAHPQSRGTPERFALAVECAPVPMQRGLCRRVIGMWWE